MRLSPTGHPVSEPIIAAVCAEAADQDPNLLTLEDGSVLLTSFSWNPMCAGDLALPGFGVRGVEGVGRLHAYWFALWGVTSAAASTVASATRRPVAPGRVSGSGRAHGGAVRGRMVESQGRCLAAYGAPDGPKQAWVPQLYVKRIGHLYRSTIARTPDGSYPTGRRFIEAKAAPLVFLSHVPAGRRDHGVVVG